eukprot:jgi/Psemu1/1238/gm1.1238_g
MARRSGKRNYSRSEVLELLHTLKAILPVGPKEWAQVAQIHKDNFPDTDRSEVKLAKKIKWLIKGKEGVGGGQEPYKMDKGYQNNMEEKEYISSEDDDNDDEDDSDNDNIPPIVPLGQPSQTTTQPTQQSMEPTQQSTEPTQPTEPTNVEPRIFPHSRSRSASSSSSSSQRFVPASPSPSSKRQEHREAAFQAQRQQTEAALELLKAAIVDVATIFLNGLHPNSNSNPNNSNSNLNSPQLAIPLKALVPV